MDIDKLKDRLKELEFCHYLCVDLDNLSLITLAEIGLAKVMGKEIIIES